MSRTTLDAILARCDAWEESKHLQGQGTHFVGDARRSDAHVGFKKLEHELAHKKGVHDPKAVAAAIGRKKLGQREMTRRSVAGRKS